MNSLFLAKVDDLLLGKTGVVLDLVDGWDDCGVGEELFKVELGVLFFLFSNGNSGEEGKGGGGGGVYVGNTDGLCLASLQQRLHLFPGINMVVPLDDVAAPVRFGGEPVVVTYLRSTSNP